jgi:calmodulin-lysine N-methyltransferase
MQRKVTPKDIPSSLQAEGSVKSLMAPYTAKNRGRWAILRKAFIDAVAEPTADSTAADAAHQEDSSIHRHDGFAMFACSSIEHAAPNADDEATSWCYKAYTLGDSTKITLRQRAARSKLTLAQLFSHRVHGVDNTGNVRVWAAEGVLLYYMLQQPQQQQHVVNKRVLEIGGGMTALAGIGLAASSAAASVAVTDGNPDAVSNQQVCLSLNEHLFGSTAVQARTLLWDAADASGAVAAVLAEGGQFDAIIGADCLFFTDFHADLVAVLQRLLAADGTVLLLQPTRGKSLDKFVQAAQAAFDVQRHDRYCDRVRAMHEQYLQTPQYDVDIHYPVLLTLRHRVTTGS